MKSICRLLLAPALLAGCLVQSELFADTNTAVLWPGLQPDGSMLLPNQWSLRPAGTVVALDDFPVNLALSPDGRYAAVLHCGYARHEVVIVDLGTQTITSRVRVNEAFYGIAFSSDGHKIYCSGASDEVVHSFSFDQGQITPLKNISLRKVEDTGVPSGLTLDRAGNILYVANLWGGCVSQVALKDSRVQDIQLSTNAAPVLPRVPNQTFDTAAATKRARAAELAASTDLNGVFPYACVLDEKSGRLYVSLWGTATVAVVDLKSAQVTARWAVGQHPCEMVLSRDGERLFVANANDNTVTVLDTQTGRATDTLWATLFPNSPRGATPNSLALSPDEKTLFVANANINAVAVFDVSSVGHGRSLGFIPTGWYPTSVRVTPDGRQLLIVSGKGNRAIANPDGPQPAPGKSRKGNNYYIGQLYKGTLDIVNLPPASDFAQQMSAWTSEVLKCTPLRPDASVTVARPPGNPIPDKPGEPCPITHCIYIIKENRTYDQIFGDIKEGNGDADLCLFPEKVTPNLHKLARDFVLLDNFYADAEVSASGHEWSMAAYASDFVEKTWPINYGHKGTKFPYPAEGVIHQAYPASGYLWDRAREAGVSYRSYGEFVQNAKKPDQPAHTRVKSLEGHFDPQYRSFDLAYSDLKRADRFISEMKHFEDAGDMPALQIVRLGNDHTQGVSLGKRTPTAFVAENDAAVGRVVDAVSHSKFWPSTAIFIIEDDAQNGPDHVDAHRTEALVVSPYTRRRVVDSTLYSTTSMLRTIELILGLQPMTQFDSAAAPMYNSFQAQPDASPYNALAALMDLNATNNALAWGANEKFKFDKEDENDDIKFNEVIWRSVKGADHPMPAPVHAGFVLSRADSKDDDD